ncbi:ABC transporter ATP-binding protein [Novispirillum sp. DQ9]|uniref:ABC transporter ATP-binding protein n=1 Tax=Novispirillum sp. DQ9 TaxID=3398612 RepID=UPI003C79D716
MANADTRPFREDAAAPLPGHGEAVLQARGLTKSFGGLTAVAHVDLTVHAGEAHAVIGPNGAGKSTLVNLLTCHLRPSAGRIVFEDRDIAGLSANRVARLGLGRSYQKTNIFAPLTVWENIWLAGQTALPHSMRFLLPARRHKAVRERVEDALEMVGLGARAHTPAAAMSHGEQRQLELAMVLATRPRLLALDEPMAGMGPEESEKVVELLLDLRKTYPLLLVEHDMDAVFSIAHTLTVMVNGRVLESGPVEQVRESAAVQEAYLGDGAEEY